MRGTNTHGDEVRKGIKDAQSEKVGQCLCAALGVAFFHRHQDCRTWLQSSTHQAAVFIFLSLTSCQTVCITGVVATPGPFIKIFLVVTWLRPSSELTARSSLTPKQHRSCARPLSTSYSSFFPLLAPALPAQDSNMVCFWGMPAFSSKTSKYIQFMKAEIWKWWLMMAGFRSSYFFY